MSDEEMKTYLILKYGSMRKAIEAWWCQDSLTQMTEDEYALLSYYVTYQSFAPNPPGHIPDD